MNTGERLQTARTLRGLTQIEFGKAIGFNESNAVERIRQYEKFIRKPKEPLIKQMAEVLGVNPKALSGPTGYEPDDVMQILFDLEAEGYYIEISGRDNQIFVTISHPDLNQPLEEWERIRALRRLNELSERDYMTWKFEWIIMS